MVNRNLLILVIVLFYYSITLSQNSSPYDNIPTLYTVDKPTLTPQTPDWALPLYEYPIQPQYVEYLLKNENFKNHKALKRYCKLFLKNALPFISEDGMIIPAAIKAYDLALAASRNISLNDNSESAPTWEFLGPKETFWLNESNSPTAPNACPWQVNIYSMDVAKTNRDILYVGTETGFVNKSVDKGMNWEFIGQDYPFGGGITAVAISPIDENMVFVAAGRQIHQTTDGGLNWQPLLSPNNRFQARRLEMIPDVPNRLIAATDKGVYISNDLGITWNQGWSTQCWDAHALPANPNHIVALTEANGDFRLIYSLNGGVSFQASTTFPSNITQTSGGLISVTPAAPEMIHVVLLSDNNIPYLYEGNGLISNWQLIAQGGTAQLGMDNGQGYYDLVLETSPVDQNLIYVGTTSLFLSRNKGQNFERVGGYGGSFPIHPDVQDLKIINETDTWVATDGGLTLTKDQFTELENATARINGIVGSDMWGFDQGWNEDIVIGGRYHNGNTAITDFYNSKALRMGGAESPTGWILKGKSRHVAFNDLGNGWILPRTAESAPEGRFIFSKYPNMDEYGGRRGNLVTHPNYYGHLILGQETGIWKSFDLGETYELIYDFGNRVRFIAQSFSDPNVLYADVVNSGFHRSTDGGLKWSPLPSLTDGSAGNTYWRGKTHFVISPKNSDHIYACLSNGTWSNDVGKIFKSTDGGDTWINITQGLSVQTKSLAIQVDQQGQDILYLACNTDESTAATVLYLLPTANKWETLGEGFPAGFSFNLILPFYRDGLIRAAGNGGIWSHDLIEKDGQVILHPWVQTQNLNCYLDTLYFNDYGILNHKNATWSWEISPQPDFISDRNARNPKVVLGSPGSFDVTLTVNKNGQEYVKTIRDMVSATTCPSVSDCNNPDYLDKVNWELLYFDSEEVNDPGRAQMAIDGDPNTIWHTRWSTGTDPFPHELQWDLGREYDLKEFKYLPRQVGVNGRINEYEVYVSDIPDNWLNPIATGNFINSSAPQSFKFPDNTIGRYIRLVCLSEINDGPWTSIAEIDLLGCIPETTNHQEYDEEELSGFPIPSTGIFSIPINSKEVINVSLIHPSGKVITYPYEHSFSGIQVDVSGMPPGLYSFRIHSKKGTFLVKTIKI